MNLMIAWAAAVTLAVPPSEVFRTNVRPTEPLTPAQQQAAFHLPPGFEIQLVAAEPDIQKPMNLAFDARGRLWVSGSIEYPYAAAAGSGRDTVKILEDTTGDGRADRITTFADDLNIPIGLYPYRDGVVVYSIPNIWFLRDLDGDGRAETREIMYGGLGTPRDTHGMQNAFRRGFDGWLYVNHGFANESVVRARDGSTITLQSGNTYRLRLDGSRVEQFTWGQVNPFGAVQLADGDQITADCHSKPLTLLLRGGYYSSFGKPHDGLGFAPDLMSHDHGSTAICGVTQLTDSVFPAEYRDTLLVGNVMTGRINQDVLSYTGSTPRAVEQHDFLTCDDPWFRPVDIQLGPDGAIYVADFYNRIIGHYEVPLEHPGRDRERGRIWRITYTGGNGSPSPRRTNLATANAAELVAELTDANLTRRLLAMDQLSDRLGRAAVPQVIESARASTDPRLRIHYLWTLFRLGDLSDAMLSAAVSDSDESVRVQALRILSESPQRTSEARPAIEQALRAGSPRERRAAADAAGQQPTNLVRELLSALEQSPTEDSALRYTLQMAVRNQLRRAETWSELNRHEWSQKERERLAEIALAVPGSPAADFVFTQLRGRSGDAGPSVSQLSFVALHLSSERVDELVEWARGRLQQDEDAQSLIVPILIQRISQRGLATSAPLRDWGRTLAENLLAPPSSEAMWTSRSGDQPWGLEPRRCADGETTTFLSSLPGGEQQTSTLRSRSFVIPPQLSFYLCGHLGFPDRPPVSGNQVVLRRTDSGAIVATAVPPRNDTAVPITWDLSPHAGQSGYLEVVDQLDLTAYAWLAVARFDPPVVAVPATSPVNIANRQIAAAGLIADLKLVELRDRLLELVANRSAGWRVRQAAAQSCVSDGTRPLLAAVISVLTSSSLPIDLREDIAAATARSRDAADDVKLLSRVLQASPAREQRLVAESLASTASGSDALLQLVERGQAAARLLQDRVVLQKLAAHGVQGLPERVARLTASLPPASVELQRLIDDRHTRFAKVQGGVDVRKGSELFARHCAACHQVRGTGALVGPQLDGIGNRGVERVIEDVLDPNRNVDATFHLSILTLSDGRVVSGLVRREEGANLVLVDQLGKEFTVRTADVDERTLTKQSLMPANVLELIPGDELFDLFGFLLSLQAAPVP